VAQTSSLEAQNLLGSHGCIPSILWSKHHGRAVVLSLSARVGSKAFALNRTAIVDMVWMIAT
jgi:hypothetical protein